MKNETAVSEIPSNCLVRDLYKFKNELHKRGIIFCFSGPVSQDLLVEIGNLLKKKLQHNDAKKVTIFRVFSLLVEMAQNIIHYSAEKMTESRSSDGAGTGSLGVGIITVGFEDYGYFVHSGNKICREDAGKLRDRLTELKKMSKFELKRYYKTKRKDIPGEKSRGAGLGLIEMARRASSPIEFSITPIDDRFSFFNIKIFVSLYEI